MQRFRRWSFLFGPVLAAMTSPCASAQVPQPPISDFGDYECKIDKVAGISASAQYYDLKGSPETFVFSAYESPVTPQELQKGHCAVSITTSAVKPTGTSQNPHELLAPA